VEIMEEVRFSGLWSKSILPDYGAGSFCRPPELWSKVIFREPAGGAHARSRFARARERLLRLTPTINLNVSDVVDVKVNADPYPVVKVNAIR
jgi:hypothetical protein